ncbi:MAG: hypothetical protein RHS_5986 [Robinsoniella sp. RHS]|nr:MAG: hypothetical protein RHS_5986 [Robinsoniella sp. RHS]
MQKNGIWVCYSDKIFEETGISADLYIQGILFSLIRFLCKNINM